MVLLRNSKIIATIIMASIVIASLSLILLPRMLGMMHLARIKTGLLISLDISRADIEFDEYYVIAQLTAILPNGTETIVYAGEIKSYKILLDPNKNVSFRSVVDVWAKRFRDESDWDTAEVALFLSLWIVNRNDPREYYRLYPDRTILYNPFKAMKERKVVRVLFDEKDLIRKRVNISLPILAGKVYEKGNEFKSTYYFPVYQWILREYWPQDNEAREIPIMILNNIDEPSGDIHATINIDASYKTGFEVTLGYGFRIYALAKEGRYAEINLDVKLGGSSLVRELYFARTVTHLLGNEQKYIYIKGKPFYGLYDEYLIIYDSVGNIVEMEPTGQEMIKTYIYDIEADPEYKLHIRGGIREGLPDLMDEFFMGTEIKQLFIDGTYLVDGDLDVGEEEPLQTIMAHFDIHKYGFNIGIPIGALIASILPQSMAFMGPVLTGLVISVSYKATEVLYIGGSILNQGGTSEGGADVAEDVYVAISKYVYKGELGEFNVPAGIYFVFDTEEAPPHSGCPYLYVYTANGFINEGLLDIHSNTGLDKVLNHTLIHMPISVNGKFLFKLIEYPKTISYIDSVHLFAILKNGSIVNLPLISAVHSVYGDVLPWLSNSDDLRIPCVGSLHTSSGSHEIFLEFDTLGLSGILALIFQIEGHNLLLKD